MYAVRPLIKFTILITSIFIFQKIDGQDSVRVIRQYENDKPKTAIVPFIIKL